MSRGFVPIFSSRIFILSGLIFQVNFYEWYKIGVKFHSYPCAYTVFQVSFFQRNYPFSIEQSWIPFTFQSTICDSLFLWCQFSPVCLCLFYASIVLCFGYCNFVANFAIRKCDNLPRPVWLSGQSIGLWTGRSQVLFHSSACTLVASRGCARGG